MSDRFCGKHYAQHPSNPDLVAVCTQPPGHDGDCSNVLPKPGASGGTPTRVFSSGKPDE